MPNATTNGLEGQHDPRRLAELLKRFSGNAVHTLDDGARDAATKVASAVGSLAHAASHIPGIDLKRDNSYPEVPDARNRDAINQYIYEHVLTDSDFIEKISPLLDILFGDPIDDEHEFARKKAELTEMVLEYFDNAEIDALYDNSFASLPPISFANRILVVLESRRTRYSLGGLAYKDQREEFQGIKT